MIEDEDEVIQHVNLDDVITDSDVSDGEKEDQNTI
jgi:hypothetical protein